MKDRYFRLVNTNYEPVNTVIDTDVANASERMRISLSLAPIFNIILQFWVNEKVQLKTACYAVTHLDLYLSIVQDIERNGGKTIPTSIINAHEKIQDIGLLAIKNVIFPYTDHYTNTGESINDDDLQYIWEYILEVYRSNYTPSNQSRFSCIFMFDSQLNMNDFMTSYHLSDGLTECECTLVETRKIEFHDMRWIDNIPLDCTFEEFCKFAQSYWNGDLTENPTIEYLFSGKYKLSSI